VTSNRPYRVLFLLRTKRDVFPVLPLRSLLVVPIVALLIIAVLFLLDRQLSGHVATKEWVVENENINLNNYEKILSSFDQPLFKTNAYTAPQPSDTRKRILIVGDSYIWGDGHTNINMIWWRQLQWELERRGYHNVDVIAAGQNGASTQDQFYWLKDTNLLAIAKPDIIVFGYVTNDPDMKKSDGSRIVKQRIASVKPEISNTSEAPITASEKLRAISFLPRWFPNLTNELANRVEHKEEYSPNTKDDININNEHNGFTYDIWEYKILEGENFDLYEGLVTKLGSFLATLETPSFFVTTATPQNDLEPRYRKIKELFPKSGIDFIDLTPELMSLKHSSVASLEWTVNPVNGHPSSRATAFYANQVANILQDKYPLVLGQKNIASPAFMPNINDWMPLSIDVQKTDYDSWIVSSQNQPTGMLYLPLKEPHMSLNFERPVMINSVKVTSDIHSNVRIWAQLLDDKENYEIRKPRLLGKGEGNNIEISLPKKLRTKRITSLKLRHTPTQQLSKYKIISEIPKNDILPYSYGGYSVTTKLPALDFEGDTQGATSQSKLIMLEDGVELPYAHSGHADIAKLGYGRYSHWKNSLAWSSSDGSNPQTNGKKYEIAIPTLYEFNLEIDFNSPAVKL